MMEFAAITKAATIVTAIGTIGGGALYLDNAHAPVERVEKLEASATVQSIQNWIRTAALLGNTPALPVFPRYPAENESQGRVLNLDKSGGSHHYP